MIRKTLTILSLLGLLLSVGAWGASYLRIGHDGKHRRILLYAGAIECEGYPGENDTVQWLYLRFHNFSTYWDYRLNFTEIDGMWRVLIPLWMPTAVFGVLFLSCRPLQFHRRERKKLGLCLKCGYDLRASKDRCPECGEFILR